MRNNPSKLLHEDFRKKFKFDAESMLKFCLPEALSVIEQHHDAEKVNQMTKILCSNGK